MDHVLAKHEVEYVVKAAYSEGVYQERRVEDTGYKLITFINDKAIRVQIEDTSSSLKKQALDLLHVHYLMR